MTILITGYTHTEKLCSAEILEKHQYRLLLILVRKSYTWLLNYQMIKYMDCLIYAFRCENANNSSKQQNFMLVR